MSLTTIIPNLKTPFTKKQTVSYVTNGISIDVNNVQFPLQTGVPVQPIYTFKVIPAPSGANVTLPYVTTTSASGFTLLPVTTTQSTTVSGTTFVQVKPIVFLGKSGALLDCERVVVFTPSVPTTATTILTLQGYDYRGVAVQTTTATIPVGSIGGGIQTPITVLTSVSFSSNPLPAGGATIQMLTNRQIGFPYFLPSASYVLSASYGGTSMLPSTSAFNPGYSWRTSATFTSTSCARGLWQLPSSPDGIQEFIMTAYYYGADSEVNAEINNSVQSTLRIVGVSKTASSSYPTPTYVYPYLVSQDLTGVQIDNGIQLTANGYAGDSAFLSSYIKLIAS